VAEDHALIRHHFPNAVIETIASAGHNPHMDTRAEFVDRVAAALHGGGSAP
jgi:pimeloyl-ACP methyl ester carboxylesterase